MSRVAIGLGANLGAAAATIADALAEIAALDRTAIVAVSSLYTSEPVGGPAQPDYTNAVCLVETSLPPRILLGRLQAIEHAHGRLREVRFGPRTLDLDILLIDGVELRTPDLEVPHPRLAERRFALEPLLEIWPDAALPDGSPLADVLALLPSGGVRRRGRPVGFDESGPPEG